MDNRKKLVFITGNSSKAKYLSDYFDISIDHKKINLHEIQSLDLREIVEVKASTFCAEKEGIIASKPKGNMGFGWDPIFIPKGCKKTWAEMAPDEKHQTSMRKIALLKVRKFLKHQRRFYD